MSAFLLVICSEFFSHTKYVFSFKCNFVVLILYHLSLRIAKFYQLEVSENPGLLHFEGSWRRQWHPTPVLLPGKSHGQRNLVGCSPWGCKESDTTEQLHFHFSLSCIGEGNGNPLQCSCLENPRDGVAWWAAIYGVAQSRTRLKQLSSSSSSRLIKMNLIFFTLLLANFVSDWLNVPLSWHQFLTVTFRKFAIFIKQKDQENIHFWFCYN